MTARLLVCLAFFTLLQAGSALAEDLPVIKKSTPVLFVDRIEPSLAFFERLGFKKTMEVPEGDALGFVAVASGPAEIMLQTRASLQADIPDLDSARVHHPTFLFVEVADLDAVAAALGDAEVFMPRRVTFYGAMELGVVEPGGHYVTFAEFAEQPAAP